MSLRQKLLLLFSLTVAAAVAAVTWTVLVRVRSVFDQRDREETALVVSQFQREFQHRSAEVASAVDHIAASEHVRTMAFELVQSGDPSPYLTEAQALAQDAQLDFLEIIGPDGKIVSSAQWPARFGYIEPIAWEDQPTFLNTEDMPDGTSALGLFAYRAVSHSGPTSDQSVRLMGGIHLDKSFLAILYLTNHREDSVSATAIPLKGNKSETVLAVLTVAISRAGMVEAQQHIRAIAYGVAHRRNSAGHSCSLWIAARVSRGPSSSWLRRRRGGRGQLGDARQRNGKGRDELGVLARSFNHMTGPARPASASGWCKASAWPRGANWPGGWLMNSRIRSFPCN
jgi:two-component system nitrogen regulation sensor histidine kinase NtrY